MPANMPPTMAEREAELAALQSAFDEYIASSRELEEELDAELAKMRKSTPPFSPKSLSHLGRSVSDYVLPTRIFSTGSRISVFQHFWTFGIRVKNDIRYCLSHTFDILVQQRKNLLILPLPMPRSLPSLRTLHRN